MRTVDKRVASVLYTTRDLTPLGMITNFLEVDATLDLNSPASVLVKAPALPKYVGWMQPENRQVVILDKAVLVGGPIEYPASIAWDADASGGDGGVGTVSCGSTNDLVWLANRVVYADPAHAFASQTADSYVAGSTNAEVLLRDLVNKNVGPGALSARKLAELVLGTLASVGTSVTFDSAFGNLLEEMQKVANLGGQLGFDVVQDGAQLKFVVRAPVDLSAKIWFDRKLNNLRQFAFALQAPTCTAALVGSSEGVGTGRQKVERLADSGVITSYGRIEQFVQGSSDTTSELQQEGDQALADGAEQAQLSLTAVDNDRVRFRRDYQLGDRVSAGIYDGLAVTDLVTSVQVVITANGVVTTPQIGSTSASSDPEFVRMIRKIDRRVGRLERRGIA